MALNTNVNISFTDETNETYAGWDAEYQSGVLILSRETADMNEPGGKFETLSFPLHRILKVTSTTERT